MILSKVKNLKIYTKIYENFSEIFEFISKNDLSDLKSGRYDLIGEDYVNIVEGKHIANDNILESHKKYIDIQYIIFGEETLFTAEAEECLQATEYDEKNDYILYKCKCGEILKTNVKKGYAVVLFPEDAHKMFVEEEGGFSKKAIFKLRVSEG